MTESIGNISYDKRTYILRLHLCDAWDVRCMYFSCLLFAVSKVLQPIDVDGLEKVAETKVIDNSY